MKLFLSGAENPSSLRILLQVKAPYLLMSYLYLRKHYDQVRRMLDEAAKGSKGIEVKLMIDSGAHTFQTKDPSEIKSLNSFGPNPEIRLLKYVDEYAKWLDEHPTEFDVAVELDLQKTVGENTVDDWRKTHFQPLTEKGLRIVYVPHEQDRKGGNPASELYVNTLKLLERFPFVGVSAVHGFKSIIPKVFAQASRKGALLHGFAVTGAEVKAFPMYSVDSTSWLAGAQYGVTYQYKNTSLMAYPPDQKNFRKGFGEGCKLLGVNFDDLLADKMDAVNLWNAHQWKMYGDWLNHRWKAWREQTEKRLGHPELPEAPLPHESLTEIRKEYGDDPLSEAQPDGEELPADPGMAMVPTSEPHVSAVLRPVEVDTVNLPLECDSCYAAATQKCGKMKPGHTCAYNLIGTNIQSPADLQNMMVSLLAIQDSRVKRAVLFEILDGGPPQKDTNYQLGQLMGLLLNAKRLFEPVQPTLQITATGTQPVGVLSRLFSEFQAPEGGKGRAREPSAQTAMGKTINIEEADPIKDSEDAPQPVGRDEPIIDKE